MPRPRRVRPPRPRSDIAYALSTHLPPSYPGAIGILLRSLGPEHAIDESIGVGRAAFVYLPHTLFVAERGLDHFELSMQAQYELTKRSSAEGSIRPYIARDPERTLTFLQAWAADKDPPRPVSQVDLRSVPSRLHPDGQ